MVKIIFFKKFLTFCSAATFLPPQKALRVEEDRRMMLKNTFSKKFDVFCSDATSQIPQSEQRIEKDIKSETLMSRKK